MIYLDHAAATPVSEKALKAMTPYFAEDFFNPSAAYLVATKVRKDYESAKNVIAHAIGGKGVDLIITAGATESINLAFSIVEVDDCTAGPAILFSEIEHPSVYVCAEQTDNFDTIKVDKTGRVIIEDLASKINSCTQLVSISLASSELGTIQPISEAAALVKAERQRRLIRGNKLPIYLHCDASQGLGLIDVKVARLGVDMLTINAAKVYGPKGIGALWVAHHVRLRPLIFGGGQENGIRSGTENVPGVIGFATVISEAEKHLASERKRITHLRELLKTRLAVNPAIEFLGSPKSQLVNFLPLAIKGLDAERLIFKLEQEEIYVSTGAACAANKGSKSRTLNAIGLSQKQIAGSLRITLGKLNDEANIVQAAEAILKVVAAEQERVHGKV